MVVLKRKRPYSTTLQSWKGRKRFSYPLQNKSYNKTYFRKRYRKSYVPYVPSVPRSVNSNLKRFDLPISSTSVTTDGALFMLNQFSRGIGEAQRASENTFIYRIKMDMVLLGSTSFWTSPNFMTQYHFLIYDRECGGMLPSVTDIFSYPSGCGNYPSTWSINRNVNSRFICKRKWRSFLCSTAFSYGKTQTGYTTCGLTSNQQKPLNNFWKKINVLSKWKDDTGGTYADLKDGGLYYVVVNDNPNKSTTFATITGNISLYFSDK